MASELSIQKIKPTIFMMRMGDGLAQRILITLVNNSDHPTPALLQVRGLGALEPYPQGAVPPGESIHEVFIPEIVRHQPVEFILRSGEDVVDVYRCNLQPPRRWVVHIVQTSHHDVGYTDLASTVLRQHDRWLDEVIDYADQTDSFPEDAQFRIVIEQAWSLDHFLKQASPGRATKMLDLLRQGRFELAALFGNLTSELCGHETLIHALSHSLRLQRLHGIPLVSTEHNDITGMSWGLARLLSDAGIKIFIPGLPLYYNWGSLGMQSFWDQQAIFGHDGPGAFWWQAPSGKKLLLWCNNSGCGGDCRADLPGLAEKLQEWEDDGYPYPVMRWPVIGAERDNSPYISGYAGYIKDWNERWASPRLVCSTNTRFYQDFVKHIPPDLPTWRGELAGQDYPVAAASTAKATAVNRQNHATAPAAEKLAVMAESLAGYEYPADLLFDAYEEILWHDEHTWGFLFPAGPAAEASEAEKALHAYRAAAHIHQVLDKALARVADQVRLETGDFHLVVFNPTGTPRTGGVRAPLRENDNCGGSIHAVSPEDDPRGSGYLKGVLLTDRWHLNLPRELIDGNFDLVDVETQQSLPFQVVELGPVDPVPYAAQRAGLGSGSARLGMFEQPAGIRCDLCFIARDVPPHGYKTYRLEQRHAVATSENRSASLSAPSQPHELAIENEFYQVAVDRGSGHVLQVFDKVNGLDLLDPACPHGLGELVVRSPLRPGEFLLERAGARKVLDGPVVSAIEITGRTYGHPQVTERLSLYAGVPQLWLEVRILKDATPLLDAQLAFPFRVERPAFRYESALSVMSPIEDYLPGSYSDAVTVQNWVQVAGEGRSVLWSSLDAPVAGLGGLWPGYVSPAHRALVDPATYHPPLAEQDLSRGWIYSKVFYNNLGTNFAVSQVCDVLFRYAISSSSDMLSDARAAAFGWEAVTPFHQVFTGGKPRAGRLPPSASLVEVDNPAAVLLAFKKAEDGEGYVLRLWNMEGTPQAARLHFPNLELKSAWHSNLAEAKLVPVETWEETGLIVNLDANAVETLWVDIKYFKAQ
jgi:hypothetical protein